MAEDLAYRTRTLPWFVSDDLIQGLTWPDLFMEYPNPKPSVIEGLKTRYLLVNEKTLEEKYKGLRAKLLADYVPVYTCKHHTVYRLRRDSAEAS